VPAGDGGLGGSVQKKSGGRGSRLGKFGRWRATLLAVVSAVAGAKAKTALALLSPPISTSRPTPETLAGWRHYAEQWRRGIPAAPPNKKKLKKRHRYLDKNQKIQNYNDSIFPF